MTSTRRTSIIVENRLISVPTPWMRNNRASPSACGADSEWMKMRKKKGCVAWLVTWEWSGDHAKVDNKVAAILNRRWSAKKVAEYVEFIYYSEYSNSEKIGLATGKLSNPYPVRWDALDGVPWLGRMTCGHNPWLFARQADNLRVEENDSGLEEVLWDERPRPRSSLKY
jgi:hypothetical protein